MRKSVLIPLVLVIIVLLGAAGLLYQKLQQKTADFVALQTDEQTTRTRYGQAINEIAAIQDSLNAVVLGEGGAQELATQLEAEKSLSRGKGDEVMARIATIKAGVERAKGRIQDLEARLQESGVKIAGLQKMIANLRKSIAEKEGMIAQLTQKVQSLETQVTGLTVEVQQGQQTIQAQEVTISSQVEKIEDSRREIGTIFYTIGSKKELSTAGLIDAKGGVLGLGKTLRPSGQIDETRFTPLDTDKETVIRIPAKEARVLSDQPAASYELRPEGEQMELHIVDPKAFRTVKHLIIMTG